MAAIAQELLAVDRSVGEHVWIRSRPDGRVFATRDPDDSLNFAHGHDRAGQPRYEWTVGADGVAIGTLLP